MPAGGERRRAAAAVAGRPASYRPGRADVGLDAAIGRGAVGAGPRPSASGTGWPCTRAGSGVRRSPPSVLAGRRRDPHLTEPVKFSVDCARCSLDPRTPVVVGGGQWSNRVDEGEPKRSSRSTCSPRRPGGRRPTPARPTRRRCSPRSTRCASSRCCRGATPTRRGSSPSGSGPTTSARPWYTNAGRQHAAVARQPRPAVDIAGRRRRRRAHRRRRGVAHADGDEGARAPSRTGPCSPRAPSRRSSSAASSSSSRWSTPIELARGVVDAGAGVPGVRVGAAGRGRRDPRRVGRAPRAAVVAVLARWRRRTRTPGCARRSRPTEVVTAGARQPHDRVPVSEAAELEQRRRAGRRGAACARSRPPSGSASRASGGCSPTPAPTATTRRTCRRRRRPALVARHPHRRRPGARARRRRRRRPRPRRPLLVLPLGRAGRGRRARARPRPRPHGHRRALASPAGPWNNYVTHSIATMARRAAGRRRGRRAGDRQRRVPHQARLRRVLHRAAGGRLPLGGAAGRDRRAVHAAGRWPRPTTRAP